MGGSLFRTGVATLIIVSFLTSAVSANGQQASGQTTDGTMTKQQSAFLLMGGGAATVLIGQGSNDLFFPIAGAALIIAGLIRLADAQVGTTSRTDEGPRSLFIPIVAQSPHGKSVVVSWQTRF